MLLAAGHSWRTEAGFARWSVALATILLLHVGGALGGMIVWESDDPPTPPPAAIMLELAPLPAAPPAPQTAAPPEPEPEPEPPVDLTQLLPPIPELPLTPPDIPVPEVALPKLAPEKKVEKPKPEKKKEKAKKEKPQKPKPKPKPDPEPDVTQKPAPQQAQRQATVSAPVQPSAAPAAPAPADVARRAAAEANWQGILLAHLERHKKYPRLARKRRAEGTAYLRFRMHRSGQVLSFTLARSAGHDSLDEEVLAMIKRAEPLPALPPEVTESEVEIVVPVQFMLR